MTMDDFLFRGDLASLDPDVAALVELEALRQVRKLIMIPSEATIPQAVREAVGSVLGNIYAEGYPPESWRSMSITDLLDTDVRLAEFRRYGSPRYYKGTEIAEIVESLARRRTAERLATDRYPAEKLFVNVQPLSGAPANSAVYTAFAKPGDTIMGMNLLDGGHLTHGSPVNRSGLFFNIVSYGVRPDDEKLDYDQMRRLALEHKPKFIVAGFTSYPWSPDWKIIREIADEAGSYVLADMSHVIGLIIAGLYPSPIGIADVVSFTTHKTLHGPRGAVLVTHRADLASKLDKAVFPGEQGGPHVNSIAGLAVAMKLAATEQFHDLQKQIVKNAHVMADTFVDCGIRVPYGGTDTHMLLIDVGKIKGKDGTPFSGELAARILDIAGVTANRNTIPGDKSPFRATGVRFGTTWITQRGFREREMVELTQAIAQLFHACQPFSYSRAGGKASDWRAKVDFETFVEVQQRIGKLAATAGVDYEVPTLDGYPKEADAAEEHFRVLAVDDDYATEWKTLHIYGADAERFLDTAVTSNVTTLHYGEWQPTLVLDQNGVYLSRGVVEKLTDQVFLLHLEENSELIAVWLTALSDGYVQFDPIDLHAKVPGPVSISPMPQAVALYRFEGLELDADWLKEGIGIESCKAYFVGCHGDHYHRGKGKILAIFEWQEPEDAPLLTTPLHSLHKELGAKMVPFAGYDMPVWYSSVTAEHKAVRTGAGLFDVTHMGVFEFSGAGAETFLNTITTNDVVALEVGTAHYSYLLNTDGSPWDDIFIYRLAQDHFMVVVNASNNDKNWTWLKAVLAGEVQIDADRPWVSAPGRDRVTMRDLRDPSSGKDRRVDLALQGPNSFKILESLDASEADRAKLKALKWSEITHVTLAGVDVYVSRTGYTGERVACEIFPHPDKAEAFFKLLVDKGATPCGLAARDSLRTEAGLPLYGHELAGPFNMNPADAGFGSYVKTWKPFFVGKRAFMEYEAGRDVETVRFQIDQKGLRSPGQGDPIIDTRGRVIGYVTSSAVDSEGNHVGLALVKTSFAAEGEKFLVYAGAHSAKEGTALSELGMGDRVSAPQAASVLSRFPKKKK